MGGVTRGGTAGHLRLKFLLVTQQRDFGEFGSLKIVNLLSAHDVLFVFV